MLKSASPPPVSLSVFLGSKVSLSREPSLSSICETDAEQDDDDLPTSQSVSSALPSSSSYATTPEIIDSDDGNRSIYRDPFSAILFDKLRQTFSSPSAVAHFSRGVSFTSTPRNASKKRSASSSLEYFHHSPRKKPRVIIPARKKSVIYARKSSRAFHNTNRENVTPTVYSPKSNRDRGRSPDVQTPKLKRVLTLSDDEHEVKKPKHSKSPLKLERMSTLSDDEHEVKKLKQLTLRRSASLRRADSLKAIEPAALTTTVPSSPAPVPVPIIAPPFNFVSLSLPTSRTRLRAYTRREWAWRDELCLARVNGGVAAWESFLGLGQTARRQAMQWITDVQLEIPPHDFSDSDSDSSAAFDDEMEDEYAKGLWTQLDIPETRFHAAYLFLLFAFKRGFRGWSLWEIATACIAISVKFHHDFLPPLLPIYQEDLLRLSPQAMSHDALEGAQRLLLRELNYGIGATTSPSGVINELWAAVPGARDSFSEKEWTFVLDEAWRVLLVVVVEPDVLQFPLSMLSAAAVIDAALSVLSWRPGDVEVDEAEGLICDVEAVLEVRTHDMDRCRKWIDEVVDAAEGRA